MIFSIAGTALATFLVGFVLTLFLVSRKRSLQAKRIEKERIDLKAALADLDMRLKSSHRRESEMEESLRNETYRADVNARKASEMCDEIENHKKAHAELHEKHVIAIGKLERLSNRFNAQSDLIGNLQETIRTNGERIEDLEGKIESIATLARPELPKCELIGNT